MQHHRFAIFLLIVLFCLPVQSSPGEDDSWEPFRQLVGQWTGEGTGFGSVSDVAHSWDFAVQEKFLRLETRSVPRGEAAEAEVHEDVGFLSHDTDRSLFVFRQFLSEGFVNTFDVTVEEGERPSILFAARESESAGGMRARMRLDFTSDTEYQMVLELAKPGQEFTSCQRMHMKKVP